MTTRTAIAIGLVLLLFTGGLTRADEPPGDEESGASGRKNDPSDNSLDVFHFIQQIVDKHIGRFDKLTTADLGKVISGTNPWDEQTNELMESWEFQNDRMFTYLEREKKDPANHQAWMDSVGGFLTNEVVNGGRTVYVWRNRLFFEKADIENAIEDQPTKLDYCRKDLEAAEKTLDAVDAMLKARDPKIEDVDDLLVEMEVAKRLVSAVSGSLQGMRETIEERFGLETPVLDKKVEAALKGWDACGDAYPKGVIEKWKERLKAWGKAARKEWDAYLTLRKEFDTAYEPVLKQTFLDGFRHLKGKQFADIEDVVTRLRDDLRAFRVKVDHRHMAEAEIQRLLEEDRKISVEEKKLDDAFMKKYSATAEREFSLYIARKTSPDILRKMRLALVAEEREKKLTEEQVRERSKEVDKEWQAILDEADREVKERKRAYDKDLAEIQKMLAERTKRRSKLGLPPGFDR